MTLHHANPMSRLPRQRGLTLVELMVALTLSLLLMAGVIQLFIANKTTYRTQDGLARVQESGRFAMHALNRSLRSAGFFGCANLELVNPQVQAASPPPDLTGPVIQAGDGINGIDDSQSAAITAFNAVGTKNAVAGTDVLTMNGGGVEGVGLTTTPTSVGGTIAVDYGFAKFATGDLLLITDCEGADLFDASSVSVSGSTSTITPNALSKNYTDDAMVMRVHSHSYFIADTGRTNAVGQAISALYRRDNDTNTDVELVEGISNMQVTYGVDVDSNREADSYVEAQNVSDWGRVVSVRVALLADSIEGTLDQEAGYNFNGATVSATAGDFRMYQEYTSLTTLRNIVL